MNNQNGNIANTLNANDFIGGYLAKEDLQGPAVVTIADVYPEAVEGASRRKLIVRFTEVEKPLILNSTNISRLKSLFGTSDCSRWIGERVTLFVDGNVEYAGRVVGGIRVSAVRTNGSAAQYQTQNQLPAHEFEPDFV